MVCLSFFFLQCIKKTIIRFGFWDVLSNQVLSCQPQPLAWLVITLTSTLIIPDTACKESRVWYPRASGFCCWASDFCYNLSDRPGKWCFLRKFKVQKDCNQSCKSKRVLGLVHASYSLPNWQAVKLTVFAPWDITKTSSNIVYNHSCNKILKSDWLSTALISAFVGQFNRAVGAIMFALKQILITASKKKNWNFFCFDFRKEPVVYHKFC